jgi:hypothetical protein
MTPCDVVGGYERFGGKSCLHLQDFCREDGGSVVLCNAGDYTSVYDVPNSRSHSESSQQCKSQIFSLAAYLKVVSLQITEKDGDDVVIIFKIWKHWVLTKVGLIGHVQRFLARRSERLLI